MTDDKMVKKNIPFTKKFLYTWEDVERNKTKARAEGVDEGYEAGKQALIKEVEQEKIKDNELYCAGAGDHTMTGAEANAWNHGLDRVIYIIKKKGVRLC